ncbi:DUF1501 domain-containing protein [Prosthecobacter algae]|uniref:DUF1501 domain-containing protein n=1 Tax=Prosthecobacter algae TaxID=1144682 RepID=A0ABP9PHQ8_9BACT
MNSGSHYNCAGVGRRDFLQIGFGAIGGVAFSDILAMRAQAAQARGKSSPDEINCILVWLDGGPSHYETFDPKPDAPREIRGEFKSIPTSVPGVHFCETMPKLAKCFDKFTVLRSLCHKDPNHGGGNHYLMTGTPTPVPVGCGAFVSFHPSFGSMVSHERGVRGGLPGYMTLPSVTRSGGPNFLGAQHAPFVIGGDPSSKSFRVRDLAIPQDISEGRALSRNSLRASLDNLKRINHKAAEDPTVGFDQFYQQGMELVTSDTAQAAFELSKEPEATRKLYGENDFGQRLLLARRLAEVGVSFTVAYWGGWDHHRDIFKTFKDGYAAKLDQGLSGLITDLDQRGMLDSTLVICLGEFGRTPKVNKDSGRDHWPGAMSVVMAGAGIPGGQIIGATDPKGYYAAENIYSPEDFAVSLYTKLGIDPHQVLHTNTGRPVQLVNGGKPIKELFA